MADTVETTFISKFHSLSGTTLKERYKNLHTLLKETQCALELAPGKIDLSTLEPTTPLEESFKVISLLHFKCVNELLEVLKGENPILIKQMFKHSSLFIKQIFDNITPEYLTTGLFPNMSYNAKLKLINQLSYNLNDTQKADKYFEAIRETYGYYLASKLLSCCSSNLIIKCIDLYKTEVTPRQLLAILNKYPDLTEVFLEKLDQQNSKIKIGEKYHSVFKFLSKNDATLFIKLYEKYSPDIQLGTRETHCFLKNAKLDTFKNTEWRKILKAKQVQKSMGHDFNDLYFKMFPKCIHEFQYCSNDYLKYLCDGPEKFKIFSDTFKKIYGNEVLDHADIMVPNLVEYMLPDERAIWIDNHTRPSDVPEETWISYHNIGKSIPQLKEKITLSSSIKTRSKYVSALIKTCKLNRDDSVLLEVVQYINAKHRNDHKMVIESLLSTLNQSYNGNQLSETHWNEIYQCIQMFILNNSYTYSTRELIEKCIFYRLSNNLPVKDHLEYWAKQFPGEFPNFGNHSKFEKYCLIEFEALVPLGYKKEELHKGYVSYLYYISLYNAKHQNNKILVSLKDNYFEHVKLMFDSNENDYGAQAAASVLIIQDCKRAEDAGIIQLLFEQNYYYLYHLRVMIYLIRENPLLIVKYFKLILKANCYQNSTLKMMRFCTKYSHLRIPQLICKVCYEILNEEEDDKNRMKVAINILSNLATPNEFLTFSSPYYPAELSPNLESKTNQTNYIKQQAIASNFRNLIPLSETVDGILHFCKGDYLKFVLNSLELASVTIIESKLPVLFTKLQGSAVSVRKHAIFLPARVLNKADTYQILAETLLKEKNSSIRKVLFKTAFHKFLNNPEDYLWKLSKQYMETIDAADGEAFEILSNCYQVPMEYFDKYMEFSWSTMEKCTGSTKTIEDTRTSLLNLVNKKNMSTLDSKFCATVIKQYLFICKHLTDLQKSVQVFTCKYLIYGPGKQEDRLQTVFSIVKNFKAKNWDNIKSTALALKLVHNFIEQLCMDIMDKNCTNRGVFESFLNMWEATIQPFEAFDAFMYLQLTSLYLKASDAKLNISQIGEKIIGLCNLLEKQNCLVIRYFSKSIKKFLEHFYKLEFIGASDENEMILIESIIKNRCSYVGLQLAISLLPSSIPISPIVNEKYDYVTDVISKEPNHLVQITFGNYLRNTTVPNV